MKVCFLCCAVCLLACRETIVQNSASKQTTHLLLVIYHHPTHVSGDTTIWYSATAHIYTEDREFLKLANGLSWRGMVADGILLTGIYWRFEQTAGGQQIMREMRRALAIAKDTVWVL